MHIQITSVQPKRSFEMTTHFTPTSCNFKTENLCCLSFCLTRITWAYKEYGPSHAHKPGWTNIAWYLHTLTEQQIISYAVTKKDAYEWCEVMRVNHPTHSHKYLDNACYLFHIWRLYYREVCGNFSQCKLLHFGQLSTGPVHDPEGLPRYL